MSVKKFYSIKMFEIEIQTQRHCADLIMTFDLRVAQGTV